MACSKICFWWWADSICDFFFQMNSAFKILPELFVIPRAQEPLAITYRLTYAGYLDMRQELFQVLRTEWRLSKEQAHPGNCWYCNCTCMVYMRLAPADNEHNPQPMKTSSFKMKAKEKVGVWICKVIHSKHELCQSDRQNLFKLYTSHWCQ